MKTYKPGSIKGLMLATIKLDGVKGIKSDSGWHSRAGKPLYNLPDDVENGEYEIYLGDFKKSISACRTHNGALIDKQHIYSLNIQPGDKLYLGGCYDKDVDELFKKVRKQGYEGLVLKTITMDGKDNELFKVKDKITIDCKVISAIEGKGKYLGKLGALLVEYEGQTFKVGTGFTDQDRIDLFHAERILSLTGWIVEVSGMELTERGVLRHPRFERLREDLK